MGKKGRRRKDGGSLRVPTSVILPTSCLGQTHLCLSVKIALINLIADTGERQGETYGA